MVTIKVFDLDDTLISSMFILRGFVSVLGATAVAAGLALLAIPVPIVVAAAVVTGVSIWLETQGLFGSTGNAPKPQSTKEPEFELATSLSH